MDIGRRCDDSESCASETRHTLPHRRMVRVVHHSKSGGHVLPPMVDIARRGWHGRKVPNSEVRIIPRLMTLARRAKPWPPSDRVCRNPR